MPSTLLAPAAHVAPTSGGLATAYSDVSHALFTVLVVMAVICGLLVVLTYLEPRKTTAEPPARAP